MVTKTSYRHNGVRYTFRIEPLQCHSHRFQKETHVGLCAAIPYTCKYTVLLHYPTGRNNVSNIMSIHVEGMYTAIHTSSCMAAH